MKKMMMLLLILAMPLRVSAEEESKRLVAIGDSIPFGYNLAEDNESPPAEAFPYVIGAEKQMEVTNLSIPGITSGELLQAVKENDLFRDSLQDVDYVVIYIGGNDLLNLLKKQGGLKGVSVEEVAPVISDLVTHVYSIVLEVDRLTDGKILVYNLYNPYPTAGEKLNRPLLYINAQYKALINLLHHFTDVQLLDAYQAFKGHPEYLIKKDVHPTEAGQQALADLAIEKMP